MEFKFSLISLINSFAFFQGVVLSIILALQSRQNKSLIWLSLFLFFYSVSSINYILEDTGVFSKNPVLLYLPNRFYLTFMPCLYFYALSMTRKINWQKAWWHWIPGVSEFLFFSVFFLFPAETKLAWRNGENGLIQCFNITHVSAGIFLITAYALLIIRFVDRHKKKVQEYFSNEHGKLLGWVKMMCVAILGLNLILLVPIISGKEAIVYEPSLIILALLNVIFIYWVTLSGYWQERVELPQNHEFAPWNPRPPEIEERDADPDLEKDYERLVQFLRENKPFLNPNFRLSDLSKQIRLPQRRISQIINEQANTNFNQFINKYRVEEAKRLLTTSKNRHLSMESIAYEAGFNTKANFYAVFKKSTGTTPYKFQQNEKPGE